MGSYLGCMENRHKTLQILSTMVQEAPQPTQYQCIPRELILRSSFDWATLYSHLIDLQEDGLVLIIDADGIKFSVTRKGLEFAKTLDIVPVTMIRS